MQGGGPVVTSQSSPSGDHRRPKLAAALAAANKAKASVVVAKLCRLYRDVAFISGLMAQRVPFIVAEVARRNGRHEGAAQLVPRQSVLT
jgi:hypothetical protein